MYVLGIDGGQTGTTCLLARTDGTILGRGVGGHLIHLADARGRSVMRAALEGSIAGAWADAGLPPQSCAAVYLGLTGVEAGAPEATIAEEIAADLVQSPSIVAANDATSALAGALLGKPGVVVVAGTGTIAFGLDDKGVHKRAGGWGWLLGDEGSAMDIGRRGLLAALHAWDGRGPATRLLPLFEQHFALSYFYDLKRVIYGRPLEARLFADLAPIVVTAAQEGDAVARRVLADAGRALAESAAAVIRQLDFAGEHVLVAPVGGVWRAGGLVRKPFVQRLRRLEPRARVVAPELPATCGAVLLALRVYGALTESSVGRLVADARSRGWAAVE